MRLLGWILLVLCAALAQHASLAAWPVAPDLPLALAAWAATRGSERVWMLRVWLAGVADDLLDPGSAWFHAGAHLVLILACMPLRRWFPAQPWLALASVGTGMSLLVEAMDIAVGGSGGWSWTRGAADALLTGGAAVAVGWLMPAPPKTTVTVEDEPAPASADPQDARPTELL